MNQPSRGTLTAKEKQIHDELDAAELESYEWNDPSRSVGVSPTNEENPCGRDVDTFSSLHSEKDLKIPITGVKDTGGVEHFG